MARGLCLRRPAARRASRQYPSARPEPSYGPAVDTRRRPADDARRHDGHAGRRASRAGRLRRRRRPPAGSSDGGRSA